MGGKQHVDVDIFNYDGMFDPILGSMTYNLIHLHCLLAQ